MVTVRERDCDEVSEDGDQADGAAPAGAPRPNCAKGPKTDVIAATATPHCGKKRAWYSVGR
jgi:hypothetical protein